MKIKVLNQDTINKIAAGEVIIRPASVVKELVENAIDAGSKTIRIEVIDGGKKSIRVVDDGVGIAYNEIPLAFKRHATSKISFLEDLDRLSTMGFRGEALSSIAAVADVRISTRYNEEELGSESRFKDGLLKERKVIPFNKGTDLVVEDLFKEIPARFKFLKKQDTEERHIRDALSKIALAHPDIDFTYVSNDRKRFQTSGRDDLKQTAYEIYGPSFTEHLHEFSYENAPLKIYGLIGDLEARRNNRNNQIFFINGRYVNSKFFSELFEEQWQGLLMKHQYPSGVIFIELPPSMLDFNIHPQKTEIRILNKSLVGILFKQSISQTLKDLDLIPQISFQEEEETIDEIQDAPPEPKFEPKQRSFIERKVLPEIVPAQTNTINEKPKKNFTLEGKDLIGILFKTYIVLEEDDSLFLIDQHAAHEAVKFEALKDHFNSNRPLASQFLLIPKEVPATSVDIEAFLKHQDELEALGFSADTDDEKLYVKSVPILFRDPEDPDLILDFIHFLDGDGPKPDPELFRLAQAACKSAVKGGDKLSSPEVFELLEALERLNNPYTCPHGRPIILEHRKNELEKAFKRIV